MTGRIDLFKRGLKHGPDVTPEPDVTLLVVVGDERGLHVGGARKPRDLDLARKLPRGSFPRILQLVRHEAAIDQHELPSSGDSGVMT